MKPRSGRVRKHDQIIERVVSGYSLIDLTHSTGHPRGLPFLFDFLVVIHSRQIISKKRRVVNEQKAWHVARERRALTQPVHLVILGYRSFHLRYLVVEWRFIVIDQFLRTHFEIRLDSNVKRFRINILACAEKFLKETFIELPRIEELDKTRHSQTHEAILRQYIETSLIPIIKLFSPVERQLFEAINLHRLICKLTHVDMTENERRSRGVLLAMCKQKLTELFLDLSEDEILCVFEIGQFDQMRDHIWKTSCDHAYACARTFYMISCIEELDMSLPTIYETYLLGIDIIVHTGNKQEWCVQVKQPEETDDVYRIESVDKEPDPDTLQTTISHFVRRVYQGAIQFCKDYPDYTFRACRITQPYAHTKPEPLEIEQIKRFFLQTRTKTNTREISRAA